MTRSRGRLTPCLPGFELLEARSLASALPPAAHPAPPGPVLPPPPAPDVPPEPGPSGVWAEGAVP